MHTILVLLIGIMLTCCPLQAGAENAPNTVVWWEVNSIELNISGNTVLIDPFFPFSRKANVILCTHHHRDHCHVPTLNKIIEISGKELGLMVGSKQCKNQFAQLRVKQKYLADRGEVINYEDLTIETVISYEDKTDLGYIIRAPRTGLSILHMGDNNRYREHFASIKDIDYLFLAMGKMSYEDMIKFIKVVKPKYLIPIHYKPQKGSLLPSGYRAPSPDNPQEYIAELKRLIRKNKFKTKVILLDPGKVIELNP